MVCAAGARVAPKGTAANSQLTTQLTRQPTPATKQCNVCKETKDAAEFSKNKATKDGMQHPCKVCASVYGQLLHRKNTKRNTLAGPPDRTGTKKCSACGETKQKTEYSVDIHQKSGLRNRCKLCGSTSTARWTKDNPAKRNATFARRRARKLKGDTKLGRQTQDLMVL
jgi:hypothetical protein